MEHPSDHWLRASALLDELLDVPPAHWSRRLEQLCPDDPRLRADVLALLQADASAGAFLELHAVERAHLLIEANRDTDPDIGRKVGPWRLQRVIGEGGMGLVFLGEREDGQFQQTAAIKLIRSERLGAESRRRFLHERQILAQLDHPNIARLLDGGVTDDGRPFFAMEYVQGLSITAYAREHHLDLGARLRLFLEVVEAVRYAHAHLVVHRDLKPSNIVVDEAGRARLLDFGIAKLLAQDDQEASHTITAVRVMTPDYAAPEQIRGEPVTTGTDVWALGVLLYELTTGRRPFQGRLLAGELERAILELDPTRPSGAVESSLPYSGRALEGDLDRIIGTALQKEPARRYPSADALGEDVRRYLAGLPVLARGDALGYRAAKFIRRHRVGVAAATLVLLSLVGGLAATAWQARRAELARRQAVAERVRAERRMSDIRQLANALLFEFSDAVADIPGGGVARERLSSRALEYLDTLATQAADDDSVAWELAAAYDRVGDAAVAAGDAPKAVDSYARALAIRRRLAGRLTPPAAAIGLAQSLAKLGDGAYLSGDIEGALRYYRDARAALSATRDAGDSASLTAAFRIRGRLCDRAVRLSEALEHCRARDSVGEVVSRFQPNDTRHREAMALSARRLGEVLERSGRAREAAEVRVAASQRARDLDRLLIALDPHVGTWRVRPKGTGRQYSPFTLVRVTAADTGLTFVYVDDAGRVVMSFTFVSDGAPVPVRGPDGRQFATMWARRLDERHFESWGEGLPYVYERSTISADGMIWTSEGRMRSPKGQEYTDVDVWERVKPSLPASTSPSPSPSPR